MASPKTVTALLAEQPEEVLSEMYKNLKAEIRRLEIETELVEEALARRSRRGGGGRRAAPAVPRSGRMSGVKRGDVLAVVTERARPVTPAEVRDTLTLHGHTITGAAVRNHLRRLVDDGELVTDGEGHYTLASANGSARNESGSPLFTGFQTQSQDST